MSGAFPPTPSAKARPPECAECVCDERMVDIAPPPPPGPMTAHSRTAVRCEVHLDPRGRRSTRREPTNVPVRGRGLCAFLVAATFSATANARVMSLLARRVLGVELGHHVLDRLVRGRAQRALGLDGVKQALVAGLGVGEEGVEEGRHLGDGELVQEAAGARVDEDHLVLEGQGHVLLLLEQLREARAAVEQVLRRRVEVRAELGEGGHLAVLGQLELEGASDLLHCLALRRGPDARHGETHVDGGADAAVEELGLEEDLAVGDGDDVGGDVGGHVAGLRLDDGQRGERARTEGVRHLGRALEEARVEVEHVSRVGLTAGGAAQQQRHLAVGHSLLGQVVVDDEGVHAVVAEELADGAPGVGRDELQRGRLGRGGRHDARVLHGARLLQRLHELRHGGALLADGHVDAVEGLGLVACRVDGLLVDHGVDGHGRLARLAIADDKLTLAAANGHERVDGLKPSLHGLVHRLARDDTRRLHLDTLAGHLAGDGALAVDSVAQGVDHAAEHAHPHRHVNDGARALDGIALLNLAVVAEDHNTDVVVLQVERHTLDAAVELNHLSSLHLVEAVHARNTVSNGEHLANLGHLRGTGELRDLLLDD
mmetsp:Transcript_17526/g.50909  ORF Transcript_17526/g.50909 Transcript_17526/m.50909 type:complete len:599 (-) Transcript_17526:209-2005(-)